MKNGITVLLVLTVSVLHAWNVPMKKPSFNCRTAVLKTSGKLSFDKQIEEDLLNGIWVEESLSSKTGDESMYFFQFNQFGAAELLEFSQKKGTSKYKTLSWRVELNYEDPLLVLRNKHSGMEQAFQIEQTCKGLDLVNLISGELKRLTYRPQLDAKQHDALKASLAGEWGNRTINSKAPQALSLSYQFKKNGTYTKKLKEKNGIITEQGRWELSRDGQFLMLECNGAKKAELVRIKYIELDELVLEQKLDFQSVGIQIAPAEYFFNKY